ncbi:MAG: hypothetical protein JWN78_3284 [Bacteroidota bacterium]|nr:hypothetical protein [Bacteroidota bacterium]
MKRTSWPYFMPIILMIIFVITSCNNKQNETDVTEQSAKNETEVSQIQNDDTDTSAVNDSQFLVDAAETNYHEIALGQVAQRNTKNGDILALAKMMIEEHTKSLGELKALADKKSITLPNSASPQEQTDLVKMKGKDFDKAYADEMVSGHKKAIEKFEMASKNCKDPDIKSWASATLPTLQKHLEHSMECQKKTASL